VGKILLLRYECCQNVDFDRFGNLTVGNVEVDKITQVRDRVARWFTIEPKIPIWVNFGRPWIRKCLNTYFMAIRNILHKFGIFYEHLVHFSCFGITCHEKSGNTGSRTTRLNFSNLLLQAGNLHWTRPGLPDGFFSNQKSQYG
jgi:hypothetical protein